MLCTYYYLFLFKMIQIAAERYCAMESLRERSTLNHNFFRTKKIYTYVLELSTKRSSNRFLGPCGIILSQCQIHSRPSFSLRSVLLLKKRDPSAMLVLMPFTYTLSMYPMKILRPSKISAPFSLYPISRFLETPVFQLNLSLLMSAWRRKLRWT